MILSGENIKKAFKEGVWTCNKSINELNFGPNSVDVTLSGDWLTPREDVVSVSTEIIEYNRGIFVDSSCGELYTEQHYREYPLDHGDFALSSVNEVINCSEPLEIDGKVYKFVPMYEGRSTMARLGVQSHLSAGFGDYGFKGSFTLEIVNHAPWSITFKEGMRIGQVYFISVDDSVKLYEGYDQTDGKPQHPRLGSGRF